MAEMALTLLRLWYLLLQNSVILLVFHASPKSCGNSSPFQRPVASCTTAKRCHMTPSPACIITANSTARNMWVTGMGIPVWSDRSTIRALRSVGGDRERVVDPAKRYTG